MPASTAAVRMVASMAPLRLQPVFDRGLSLERQHGHRARYYLNKISVVERGAQEGLALLGRQDILFWPNWTFWSIIACVPGAPFRARAAGFSGQGAARRSPAARGLRRRDRCHHAARPTDRAHRAGVFRGARATATVPAGNRGPHGRGAGRGRPAAGRALSRAIGAAAVATRGGAACPASRSPRDRARQPRRAAMRSAARVASAMIVSCGLTASDVGTAAPSVT